MTDNELREFINWCDLTGRYSAEPSYWCDLGEMVSIDPFGPCEPSVSYQRDASGGWDVGYLPLGGDLPWHYVGRFRDRESAKARAEEVAIILLGAMDLDHLEGAVVA